MDLRFPCSNPIHIDYLVRITLHWSLIYANTEGCSAPASSGRRLNALSPDLRLFLPKQKRQLEGERLPAGWRGSWRRREGSTGWQACRGQDRRGEQDAIQCLNLYFPRISSAFLCFLFAHNFYKLSQHSLKNVIRRIIDICRTSLYANQQSLLTPVIADRAPTRLIISEFTQNFWVFFVLYSRLLADFLSHLGKWVKSNQIWGWKWNF